MTLPFDPYEPLILPVPRFYRGFFRLSQSEATFAKRGFAKADLQRQVHLEAIGTAFIEGYNTAVMEACTKDVRAAIDRVSVEFRGFAAEGSAMGAAMLDALSLRAPLLPDLLSELERDFVYLAHVGAGWAMARLPWRRRKILGALDPLNRWLAFDGIGFHDSYFGHARVLRGWKKVKSGYAARAYDQGVGRALWFISGGSFDRARRALMTLPSERRADLWAGLGLAMTYAGGATEADFIAAVASAASHRGQFAQGVAFACEARVRGGHVPPSAKIGSYVVAGLTPSDLAERVRRARDQLPSTEADLPRYELWRQSLSASFATLVPSG